MQRATIITTAAVLAAQTTFVFAPDALAQSGEEIRRIAGTEPWKTDFTRASVPLSEIVSGGPQRDGIPSIDQPRFETAAQANEWLSDLDPVVVIESQGIVKAYPLAILIWHEIVNDRIGEVPVAVTFCPLCNTALAFDRRVQGLELVFGTTGRLRHSDLIMYDRQTETWWQQAVGEAIIGEFVGRRLELVSANTLGWESTRELYPDVRVLSRDTGHASYAERGMYGRNPYTGYDDPDGEPWKRFISAESDPKLPAMERVAAIDIGAGWAAAFADLRASGPAHAEIGDMSVVIFWAPGTASATDETRIANSRDVGQTAAFEAVFEGRLLHFRRVETRFEDAETGSTWDLAGRATAGALEGARLNPVAHGNHFWFAWVVFRPDTHLWRP